MNSLSVKAKCQIGQLKSLKQIASLKANLTMKVKFKAQVFEIVQDLQRINTQLKFEGNIPTVQKLLHSQGVTQNFQRELCGIPFS